MLKQAALGAKSHGRSSFTAPSGTSTTIVVVSRPLPMTTFIGSDTRSRWLADSQLVMPSTVDGTVVSGESSRYYLADIGPASNRHLLMVALVAQADPAAERLRFEKAVAPILQSLDASHVTFN